MIFGDVGPDAVYYRVLTPSWAFEPKSGAGAAAKGGRFNRPGTHGVYLSTAPDTAIAEYGQAEQLFSPGTLAAYQVRLVRIVDFSGGFSPSWDALWREWDCAWKDLWFRQRIAADLGNGRPRAGLRCHRLGFSIDATAGWREPGALSGPVDCG